MSIFRLVYTLIIVLVGMIFAFGMLFGSDQINWWLTWVPVAVALVVPLAIVQWIQDAPKRKERKALEKERRMNKVCSWCNKPFTWSQTGYRYHCSQKCETENTASR